MKRKEEFFCKKTLTKGGQVTLRKENDTFRKINYLPSWSHFLSSPISQLSAFIVYKPIGEWLSMRYGQTLAIRKCLVLE